MNSGAVVLLTLLVGVCMAVESPTKIKGPLLLRQRREVEIYGNTRKLIEKLVANLRDSARQAITAVQNFTLGIEEQGSLVRERILEHLEKLRERVQEYIRNTTDKLSNANSAVKECIASHDYEAQILYNQTLQNTLACADKRIQELGDTVGGLKNQTNNAIQFANEALEKMKECTAQNSNNILAAGACLGTVAFDTEIKSAVFAMQSGVAITRINFGLATLPAFLEVCAGQNLFEAGVSVARIITAIGSCSASSVFSTFSGNS